MALARLAVEGFRNLATQEVEFAPGTNYLFGPNGSGKTNLLEAVHYLAIGRSFRHAQDRDLLTFGSGLLAVSGSDDEGNTAEIRYDGREKRVLLNGSRVARLSDFLGWLPVIVLLLEDVVLVRGAPVQRRLFLDMAIAKVERRYIAALSGYRRVLMQRNRLLEQHADTASHDAWEEELVRTGLPIIERRRQVVGRLLGGAEEYCRRLGGPEVAIDYQPSVAGDGDPAVVFREQLRRTRRQSIELGFTVVGPHRDDIAFCRGGRDLRRFGSVGEQRLAAVALRLAEADVVAAGRGRKPVFLLDEVASELDEARSGRVFELVVERGQSVYAAARRFDVDGREFHVEAGKVTAAA